MGRDISTIVQIKHPEHGWLCTGSRLSIDRDYDLFRLIAKNAVHYGFDEPECKCHITQIRTQFPHYIDLATLRRMFDEAKGQQAVAIAEIMQIMDSALPRMGDDMYPLTDHDVRIAYTYHG